MYLVVTPCHVAILCDTCVRPIHGSSYKIKLITVFSERCSSAIDDRNTSLFWSNINQLGDLMSHIERWEERYDSTSRADEAPLESDIRAPPCGVTTKLTTASVSCRRLILNRNSKPLMLLLLLLQQCYAAVKQPLATGVSGMIELLARRSTRYTYTCALVSIQRVAIDVGEMRCRCFVRPWWRRRCQSS